MIYLQYYQICRSGSRKVQDSTAEKIAEMLDNIDELIDKVVEQDKKQKQILEQLDKVEQPYRLILEEVYINNKSLVEVASELKYSYVDICRKHGKALNRFDKCA